MTPGNNVTIMSGSRLRRISEDGKRLLDQSMNEGALVEHDKAAKVTNVIESQDGKRTAYMVEVKHDGKLLVGWCYGYEITAGR